MLRLQTSYAVLLDGGVGEMTKTYVTIKLTGVLARLFSPTNVFKNTADC